MSASVYKASYLGSGLMASAYTVPAGYCYRLISVSVKFSSAPTTSENLTLTLDANVGGDYDVLLYSVDPAAGATTDIFWQPNEELFLEGGDALDLAYANTDRHVWAAQVTAKRVV